MTIVLGTLLGGCGPQIYYTPLQPAPHQLASHRIEDVQVLAVTPPSVPHTDIGLYQISPGIGGAFDTASLIASLRAEAAARGCDAILVTSVAYVAYERRREPTVQASCVVYSQPVSTTPPRPSRTATAGAHGALPAPAETPGPPPAALAQPTPR